MSHPTTPPVPTTRLTGKVTGTVDLDVGELALRIADMVVPRILAAMPPAADPDDRNGPYIPDLPRKVPPQRGDYGAGGARVVSQACPSCGSMFWADPDQPGELCATCQQHGDLRKHE